MDIKQKAHKYLIDKGCLSISQTYTAFKVEKMLVECVEEILRETKQENFYEGLEKYFETTPKEEVNWKVVYEDSLSMQKCSNAGYESKISELQEQIKRSYSEEDMKQSFYAGIRKAYSSKKHSECWEE